MPIPKSVLERGLELAGGTRFYGCPIEELTREELVAIAVLGAISHNNHLKEEKRRSDFMRALRRQ